MAPLPGLTEAMSMAVQHGRMPVFVCTGCAKVRKKNERDAHCLCARVGDLNKERASPGPTRSPPPLWLLDMSSGRPEHVYVEKPSASNPAREANRLSDDGIVAGGEKYFDRSYVVVCPMVLRKVCHMHHDATHPVECRDTTRMSGRF